MLHLGVEQNGVRPPNSQVSIIPVYHVVILNILTVEELLAFFLFLNDVGGSYI